MKYTAEDIKITAIPVYEGEGLDIYYSLQGEKAALLAFSKQSLIEALIQTEHILEWDQEDQSLRRNFNSPWVRLDFFMDNNLGLKLAEDLVLHHLNNSPEKPCTL